VYTEASMSGAATLLRAFHDPTIDFVRREPAGWQFQGEGLLRARQRDVTHSPAGSACRLCRRVTGLAALPGRGVAGDRATWPVLSSPVTIVVAVVVGCHGRLPG
jgi:hypothetical protein